MADHCVYRFYADDQVLYVGRSSRLPKRIRQHRRRPWFSEATRIELEHFEHEEEMIDREAALIRELRPLYNIALMGEPPSAPADPAPAVGPLAPPLVRGGIESWHSLADVAARYGVPVEDVRAWCREGMRHWRIAQRLCGRFSETDAWVTAHRPELLAGRI